MDRASRASTLGKVGRAASVPGAIWGLYTGIQDFREALDTDDPLDRRDLYASAAGALGGAALSVLALLPGGPPGWVIAAAMIALQIGVQMVHNYDEDMRNGHADEANLEKWLGPFGLLYHLWHTMQDSDELNEHPLESPVPDVEDVS